jgi:hypothetical protein
MNFVDNHREKKIHSRGDKVDAPGGGNELKSNALGGETELNSKALGGGTACGGSPWSEPRKAASPTHPFLRKGKAMFAPGKRLFPPATLSFRVENTLK